MAPSPVVGLSLHGMALGQLGTYVHSTLHGPGAPSP